MSPNPLKAKEVSTSTPSALMIPRHTRFGFLHSETALVTLILIALLIVFYWNVIFWGSTFLAENSTLGTMPPPHFGPYGYPPGQFLLPMEDPGGLAWAFEPWNHYISQTLKSGQLPLWNPHQGLGVPLHANGQSGLFDPLNILTYAASANLWPVAMDLELLLRYLIAGVFTYLFVRSLGVRAIGALGAGIIFVFSKGLVDPGNIAYTHVEVLLPLTVYAYHRLATRRTTSAFAFTIFAVFLLVVTDFPELVPLQIGLGLLWYIFQSILMSKGLTKAADIRAIIGLAIPGLLATIFGVLMSAFVVLPFLQTLSLSVHSHDPAHLLSVYPPVSLLNAIGNTLIHMPDAQPPTWTSMSIVLLIFGAHQGLSHWNHKEFRKLAVYAIFFITVACLFLLLITRISIFGLLAGLPIINMIDLNRYLPMEIFFCGACGAGIGLDFLFFRKSKRRFVKVLLSALTMLALAVLVTWISADFDQSDLTARIIPLLFLLLCITIMIDLGKWGIRFASLLILGLLLAEPLLIVRFPRRPLRYDPYTVPPFVTYLQSLDKPFRIVGTDGIIYPNISTVYQLDDIRYLDAVNPRNYDTFRRRFLDPIDHPEIHWMTRFDGIIAPLRFDRALDMLNVEYVLTTCAAPPQSSYAENSPFELVHQSAGIFVYHNKNAYPRAFIVHQAEVIPDENAALDRFADAGFDPRQTAILDEPLLVDAQKMLSSHTDSDGSAPEQVTVSLPDVNSVTIQATLTHPGLVLLSDLDYPGWEVYVDGSPAHIYEADTIIRAVYVGAGAHTIEYLYRPPLLFLGFLITAGTLVILVAVLFIPSIGRFWFQRRLNKPA